ncbi:hypothetical protein GCM10027566_35090 [Arachidicoccus ginsenosidivorans]|uniref:ATP-binding protein n=1 Tax=Arachidicoccus ginsenosidivorans TaxID=496057 RepID=A0A5B8VJQ2_9BACT|nr:ATP-binding protein [Arachidicoccus ginsenosidivorans]QEC71700.1 ATP-binding protein [Arachidicoccus ginsenosidivorans]
MFKANASDELRLHIGFLNEYRAKSPDEKVTMMLYSDELLLITTAVHQLKSSGASLCITTDLSDLNRVMDKASAIWVKMSGMLRYASRIDFFKLLDLQHLLPEKFTRRPGRDRFIEITHYNRSNYIEVGRRVVRVVGAHTLVDSAVQQMLDFCLFEILDNVLIHSAYPAALGGSGWCSAQHFPAAQEIRLIIADTGIGIHRALTGPEGSKFRALSEKQALYQCVKKGVTNGEGMGFGLYATREFVRLNQGELLIYSGSHFATLQNGRFKVKQGAYWPGTVVYLRIKTNISVDYNSFMPKDHPLAADFDYFYANES